MISERRSTIYFILIIYFFILSVILLALGLTAETVGGLHTEAAQMAIKILTILPACLLVFLVWLTYETVKLRRWETRTYNAVVSVTYEQLREMPVDVMAHIINRIDKNETSHTVKLKEKG